VGDRGNITNPQILPRKGRKCPQGCSEVVPKGSSKEEGESTELEEKSFTRNPEKGENEEKWFLKKNGENL